MLELLSRGGPVMYFILASSIVAVAIAIERIVYYRLTRSSHRSHMKVIREAIENGNLSAAIEITKKFRSAIGRITHVYLQHVDKGEEILEEAVKVESQESIIMLEKHLPILSAIGNLAPLMGLLGTVIGMIYVFKDIAALGGQADINILAGGIWQALLTTAFGLVVAIPVTGFYHYFQNLVDERIARIERRVSELNLLFGTRVRSEEITNINKGASHGDVGGALDMLGNSNETQS